MKISIIFSLLMSLISLAHANSPQFIAKKLAEFSGGAIPPAILIERSVLPGWWTARLQDGNVIYIDDKGTHVFIGTLMDLPTGRNLTDLEINKFKQFSWGAMPLTTSIKQVKGNGRRQVVIFADPNCVHCKTLYANIASVQNVTIHTVLIPVVSNDSKRISSMFYCAKDPVKSWLSFISKGELPLGEDNCASNPVEFNTWVAKQLNINSTPTVVFSNGQKHVGALSLSDFNRMLTDSERK